MKRLYCPNLDQCILNDALFRNQNKKYKDIYIPCNLDVINYDEGKYNCQVLSMINSLQIKKAICNKDKTSNLFNVNSIQIESDEIQCAYIEQLNLLKRLTEK